MPQTAKQEMIVAYSHSESHAAFITNDLGTSLQVQQLKLQASKQEAWVPSLAGELRSHMPRGVAKKILV